MVVVVLSCDVLMMCGCVVMSPIYDVCVVVLLCDVLMMCVWLCCHVTC